MTEGKIEIYLSHREPEYRDNLMWLRPYLDREGYELLYYGSNGWTRFVPYHSETADKDTVADTPDYIEDIVPEPIVSEIRPCRCPDLKN